MAGTTADKLAHAKAVKADLKAALTEKGQTPGDVFAEYPSMVRAIETGTELPALTSPGAAADLRQGKQLIDQEGNVVEGSLVEVDQATPSISVSAAGLITASAQQTAGYVSGGTKSATQQLATQAAKTVTPGTSSQTAVASGRYTTGAVTVAGDANLVAENIKSGVSIFGVTGSLEGDITVETFTHDNVSMTEAEYKLNNITRWGTAFTIEVPGLTSSSQLVGLGFYIEYGDTSYDYLVFGPCPTNSYPVMGADMNGNAAEFFTVTLKTDCIVLLGEGSTIYGFLSGEGLEDPADWNDAGGWIAFRS